MFTSVGANNAASKATLERPFALDGHTDCEMESFAVCSLQSARSRSGRLIMLPTNQPDARPKSALARARRPKSSRLLVSASAGRQPIATLEASSHLGVSSQAAHLDAERESRVCSKPRAAAKYGRVARARRSMTIQVAVCHLDTSLRSARELHFISGHLCTDWLGRRVAEWPSGRAGSPCFGWPLEPDASTSEATAAVRPSRPAEQSPCVDHFGELALLMLMFSLSAEYPVWPCERSTRPSSDTTRCELDSEQKH